MQVSPQINTTSQIRRFTWKPQVAKVPYKSVSNLQRFTWRNISNHQPPFLDIRLHPHTPVKYHCVAGGWDLPPHYAAPTHTHAHTHSVLGVNCDFWVTADVLEESRWGAEVSVAPELHPPLSWNFFPSFFLWSWNKKVVLFCFFVYTVKILIKREQMLHLA